MRRIDTELVQAVDHDMAAHPQHGRQPNPAQKHKERRHANDKPAPERRHSAIALAGKEHPEIIGLHDQPDGAVDHGGNSQRHHHQRGGLFGDGLLFHRAQRDRHDFGRQDEIGADGARYHRALLLYRVHRSIVCGVFIMRVQLFPQFFRAFETQERPACHQQRGDYHRQEVGQRQRAGQQEHQFVFQAAARDLGDDGDFAIRRKTGHIARRDGCIIDHHAGRLGRSLDCRRCGIIQAGGRHGANIIDAGRRHLGDRRNIIQQCKQAACHALSPEDAAV